MVVTLTVTVIIRVIIIISVIMNDYAYCYGSVQLENVESNGGSKPTHIRRPFWDGNTLRQLHVFLFLKA